MEKNEDYFREMTKEEKGTMMTLEEAQNEANLILASLKDENIRHPKVEDYEETMSKVEKLLQVAEGPSVGDKARITLLVTMIGILRTYSSLVFLPFEIGQAISGSHESYKNRQEQSLKKIAELEEIVNRLREAA